MRYFERFRCELTTVVFAASNVMPPDVLEKWLTNHDIDNLHFQGFKVYCEVGKATERIPQWVTMFKWLRPDHPVEFVPNVPTDELELMLGLLQVIGGHVEGMHDKAAFN